MNKEEKVIQTQAEVDAILDIHSYNTYIVYFSGGKDSIACFLYLLEQGVDKSKIELWHHDIDGREGSTLMDWRCTPDYCKKFAEAFGVPIYFSWREGGFEREMLRQNQLTGDIYYEMPDPVTGETVVVHKPSQKQERYKNTRLKFPQVSADLKVRWCSGYLKIDVGAAAVRGQERFNHSRTLVLTGERGEESSNRSKYNIFEPDTTDGRKDPNNPRKGKNDRLVDHLRPIRDWKEDKVWDIIQKFGVNPHPAYRLGFGRVSCMNCIFGNADQFASAQLVDPQATEKIANYEEQFGVTIKRKDSVRELISKGSPYPSMTQKDIEAGRSKEFKESILLPPGEWKLPAGAYGESCGPL
jgi:3'-phosphoadenosine 5'-phosphosulfate sulfotransferase (PAPS reductase)/FAD synthetase